MNKDIEKIDELIKEALTKEEAAFYDELEEQNLLEKVGGVFRGKYGWIAIIMNIVNLIIFGFTIYCAIQLFNTDVTNELIKWSLGIVFGALFMSMIKLYVWMQMDKNDILRELKRIELQIATLATKKEK